MTFERQMLIEIRPDCYRDSKKYRDDGIKADKK